MKLLQISYSILLLLVMGYHNLSAGDSPQNEIYIEAVVGNTSAGEEGLKPASVRITRRSGSGALTVLLSSSGSALLGTDYSTSPNIAGGSISFTASDTEKIITITPIQDATVEGRESAQVNLLADSTYIISGPNGSNITNSSASVYINDNDVHANGLINPRADFIAEEDAALAGFVGDVEARRRGILGFTFKMAAGGGYSQPNINTIQVQFNGTAANGTDYKLYHKINDSTTNSKFGSGNSGTDTTTGLGYSIFAYRRTASTLINISGGSNSMGNGVDILIAGDAQTYNVSASTIGASGKGTITVTPALRFNVPNGAAVSIQGAGTPPTGFKIDRPYGEGDMSFEIGGGSGGIFIGDAFKIEGDNATYVATNSVAGSEGILNFKTYENGGNSGLNVAVTATKKISTVFETNVNAVSGLTFFNVPNISDRVIFSIEPIADALIEGEETVNATLMESGDYLITNPTQASCRIADANVFARIERIVHAGKPSTNGIFRMSFTGGVFANDVQVPYTVKGTSSAIPGTDYEALYSGVGPGYVTLLKGTDFVDLVVRPKDSLGTQSLEVQLESTYSYKLLGSNSSNINPSATMNIVKGEGVISASTIVSSTQESPTPTPAKIRISIDRVTGSINPVIVKYSLSGSANHTSRLKTIPNGQATILGSANSVDVDFTPLDDSVANGEATVTLTLDSGEGYVIISGASSPSIKILDNEPTVSVVKTTDATKPSSSGTFTFSYTGAAIGRDLEVFYNLSGNAVQGTDFNTTSSDKIIIQSNSSSRTLNISPISTPNDESNKTLTVTILNGQGYSIGSNPSNMTIFGIKNASENKTTPGAVSSGSGGGCGLGSGMATFALFLFFGLYLGMRRR